MIIKCSAVLTRYECSDVRLFTIVVAAQRSSVNRVQRASSASGQYYQYQQAIINSYSYSLAHQIRLRALPYGRAILLVRFFTDVEDVAAFLRPNMLENFPGLHLVGEAETNVQTFDDSHICYST